MKNYLKVFKELLIGFALAALTYYTIDNVLTNTFASAFIMLCVELLVICALVYFKQFTKIVIISAVIFYVLMVVVYIYYLRQYYTNSMCSSYGVKYHLVEEKENTKDGKRYKYACCPEKVTEIDNNKCVLITE